MSLVIHTYFLNEQKPTEKWAFQSIVDLFLHSDGVKSSVSINPINKKNFLRLIINDSYFVSIFFESGERVDEDLKFILREQVSCHARIRILFGPDPDNNYDDIKIIILDFLQDLENVLIYNVNQEKIILDPLND